MIRLAVQFAPVIVIWSFLFLYENNWDRAERAAFWAMIGLS